MFENLENMMISCINFTTILVLLITLLRFSVSGTRNTLFPADFNRNEHYLRTHRNSVSHTHTQCTENAHTHGKWVLDETAKRKKRSFPCCGWGQRDFLWNVSLCGARAMEEWTYHGRSNEPHYVQLGGNACACDQARGREEVHSLQRYRWEPSYCQLTPFDAEYFCALLGPRRMLFVGDSTFGQTAGTLMNLLRAACQSSCAQNVLFSHVNQLTDTSKDRRFDWMDHVLMHDPQIVILGVGAHFHSLEAYASNLQLFEQQWRDFEAQRRAEYVPQGRLSAHNITYVWKTINPGHIGCQEAEAPVQSVPFVDPGDRRDRFRWGLFDVFDTLGKQFALTRGMRVLDMFPLYLRPDAHPGGHDCLHFCLPGPVDIIGDLLLNMMHAAEI